MGRENVTLSKITSPLLSDIIPRKRLFRLLDTGRKRPIVWICGPPGSGKTSLYFRHSLSPIGCALCKPYKHGWAPKKKTKVLALEREADKEMMKVLGKGKKAPDSFFP